MEQLIAALKRFFSNSSPWVIGGGIIGGLIALLFVLSIAGAFLKTAFLGNDMDMMAPMMAEVGYGGGFSGARMAYDDGAAYSEEFSAKLSTRNAAAIYPPMPGGNSVGDTAEMFEVMQYSANYESGDVKGTCAAVMALKEKEYVIFEHSNEYTQGCSYTFKVRKANVEEILGFLTALDPKDLSQNIRTIKQQLDDFTAETEVLSKKKESIESTLSKALLAYDEVTALAVRSQNAEALASAINSKIQLIERLTQERITINEQLDRLARAKSQQLDQVDYTFFNVSVIEKKYVDWRSIGESWQFAIQQFVREVNHMLQKLSLGLLSLLLVIIQYAIYFFALVLIAKYGWKATKLIWNK